MRLPDLPITSVLPELKSALDVHSSAVLIAPPGAGKTTVVPLALRKAHWLDGKRIVMLEPRRLAARGAARRLAETLGDEIGGLVGLRARLETRVGPSGQIEVMTEGVFTRMALDDPSLEGVGAVLFDEFHERSLDTDFGLALALDIQSGLREDLRILVMSATLDGGRVADMLGDAPVIESKGKSFPVETRYLGRPESRRIEDGMADAVERALRTETGSILAFLPGQGEIRRTERQLRERAVASDVFIAPLYGALDAKAQDAAIQPPPAGKRKVVLATAVAETSLTIEGVRVVIDSGLARVPRYDPAARLTRLETVRVSRASADQRRGRAGRLTPGVCFRLWDEPETRSLRPFETPEIQSADLTGLVLDCAAWGVTDPTTMNWLDPPPEAALELAKRDLVALDAISPNGHITDYGHRLRALALPARLAAMLVEAASIDQAADAATIAAVIVERGLGGMAIDLEERLRAFRNDRSQRARAAHNLARSWARTAESSSKRRGNRQPRSPAGLLAFAYPDRIAKARNNAGEFVLANGRGGRMDAAEPLAGASYLVVGELIGSAAAGRITLAAALGDDELAEIAGDRISENKVLTFDRGTASVRARLERRLDSLVIESKPVPMARGDNAAAELCKGIAALGIDCLPWTKAQRHLRQRIAFLASTTSRAPIDLSDAALADTLDDWLTPFLDDKSAVAEITANELDAALAALIPWDLRQRADTEAPTHFTAPTGNRHPIDYDGDGAPSISLRVQELFGLTAHPAIAGGRLPLTLFLLSPAGRPLQVTRDLPGFWSGSWRDVAAEMKGRYPKHPWPDDPANAPPTARAKPRRR